MVSLLPGCGTVEVFGRYDLPEGPGVEDSPWPRLVDGPTLPSADADTNDVPDPESGPAARRDLSAAAGAAEVRRKRLLNPVIEEAERARMRRRAEQRPR